ncbi:MAG: HlyD family efflux transporter periplasmic adaptor subunit [Planctomycetales bacterium]
MSGTMIMIAAALVSAGPPNQSRSRQPPALPPTEVAVSRCLVTLLEEVEVPARAAGVVAGMEARPGMWVKRGQELARLDDRQAQLEKQQAEHDLEASDKEAENDVRVRFASKSWEVARAELQQKEASNRRLANTVPPQELRRYQLSEQRARLEIEQAQHDQSIVQVRAKSRGAAVEMTELRLSKHRVVAPIDGLIAETHRRQGEWVDPGDPVIKIYRMDRLRVEGFLNVRDVGLEVRDCLVTVNARLPGGRSRTYPGKIVFVHPKVDAVTGEFRVWAEVRNHDLQLLPGLKASMIIHLQSGAIQRAKRTSAQPVLRR